MQTAKLIGLIYDSAMDPSRWPEFLENLAAAIKARRASIAIRDLDREMFGTIAWYGWTDSDMRIYNETYAAIDPWGPPSCRYPEGNVGNDFDLCPRADMEASRAFQEFYAPRDCVHGMGGTILITGTGQSLITAGRGYDEGPFGEQERAVLLELMPHLRRAALIHGELGSSRRRLETFTAHLDRSPHGLILTNAEHRVLFANLSAREMAARKDAFSLDNGRVRLSSQRDDTSFTKLLEDIESGRASLGRLEIRRKAPKQFYRLIMMSIKASRAIPLGVAVPAVSVFVVDNDSQIKPNVEFLRELYNLTPAETRITIKLIMGRNAEEISSELGTSVETVRTHIKRVLSKTGTERQGELISLIFRNVPLGQI